ncbi:MAG TPA: hypothetical protein VFF73_37225 [Planctomycetota bacterium]|nr:hypothetical protein [Planctomycetota bacterium]
MDKATLLEKIKKNDLRPKGRILAREAKAAIEQLALLRTIKDLDPMTLRSARRELTAVVVAYRDALRVKKARRKKHTRG